MNFDCDIENKVDLEIEDIPDENSNHTLSNIEHSLENENIASELAEAIPNYSLDDLSQIEGLSIRAITICENYELTNLEKILHFYFIEKESFKHLRNCGKNTDEELVAICKKYKNSILKPSVHILTNINQNSIDNNCDTPDQVYNLSNISLNDLVKNENLSARSCNVCNDNGLKDLPSIIAYYWEYRSFKNLRNCGRLSDLELIDLCKKYEILIEKSSIVGLKENPINPIILKIDSLTVKQKQIINNFLVSKFNELPIRPQNALNALLDNEITLKNFADIIFSNSEFNTYSIKNIGALSEIQINTFLEVIKEQIELVSSCQDEREIEIKLCETFLIKNFSIIDTTILSAIRDYDFANGLPIFKIIKVLVDNDILFEIREKQIFTNEFCSIDQKEFKSLSDLSIELGVTRERVRQIRVQFLGKFESYFRFITQPEIKSLVNYNIDLSSCFIDISDELIDRINISEKVKFNQLFINRIFVCLYSANFELVGSFSQNIHEKDIATDKWKRSYLIDKKITAIFDFEKFYYDVRSRLSNRVDEDYSLYFQTYLLNFLKTRKYEMLDNIVEIAEYILFNEFELSIDTFESIVFKRNTIKQVYEYSYEALEKLGKPSKVNEIYQKVIELYPDYETDENSIRASMKRDTGFVPIGRTSVYGLKKWESQIDDFKGGTIRDIAEEFLQSQVEPKHIDEITEYVNLYRDTTSKNIYPNLKLDESKRFVFFKGLLIGLSSKKYSLEKYVEPIDPNIERKSWEERFFDLQKFAEENNRLPKSISNDKEKVLYRFMNIHLNKATKSQIDDRALRINELATKYQHQKRKRKIPQEWNANYDDLMKFVAEKKRLPKARIEEEEVLYNFFYRQRKLYQEDNLSLISVEKLLEIAKLLN